MSQAGNNVCFECGKPSPTCASPTYGVYLCDADSAKMAKELGWVISTRELTSDKWDNFDMTRMSFGGNNSFAQCMNGY